MARAAEGSGTAAPATPTTVMEDLAIEDLVMEDLATADLAMEARATSARVMHTLIPALATRDSVMQEKEILAAPAGMAAGVGKA